MSDKLEFVEQYFEICYNQLRILEFAGELYENKKGCCTAIRYGMAISF